MRLLMSFAAVLLVGVGQTKADFILIDSQHLDVDSSHNEGVLWDNSSVGILEGGVVMELLIYNDSSVNILEDGEVQRLNIFNNSSVNVLGGVVEIIEAWGTSSVNITEGLFFQVDTYDNANANILGGEFVIGLELWGDGTVDISDGIFRELFQFGGVVNISGGEFLDIPCNEGVLNISGGVIDRLQGMDNSVVSILGGNVAGLLISPGGHGSLTFHGYDFEATGDLYLEGENVLPLEDDSMGTLSGKWYDGTPWSVNVSLPGSEWDRTTITVVSVPEPSGFGLLFLGLLLVGIRCQKRRELCVIRTK